MTWTMEYAQGRRFPRLYGVAWRDAKDSFVLLPVPFNVMARWFRELWFKCVENNSDRQRLEQNIRDAALKEGFNAGRASLRAEYKRHLAREFFQKNNEFDMTMQRAEDRAENIIQLMLEKQLQ